MLVAMALFSMAMPETSTEEIIKDSATLLDLIQEKLLTSNDLEKNGVKFEYMGLLSISKRKQGFLQGLPCSWRFFIRDGDTKKDIFYASISTSPQSIPLSLGHGKFIKFILVDKNGHECSKSELILPSKKFKTIDYFRLLIEH